MKVALILTLDAVLWLAIGAVAYLLLKLAGWL